MALRLVGDPRTVVVVLGPEGRIVGHVLVDLHRYGIDDPVLDGDLRPHVLNCLDGLVFTVHRESDHKARYLQIGPGQISKHPGLAEASRLPCADVYVQDYVGVLLEINREETERLKKLEPRKKKLWLV